MVLKQPFGDWQALFLTPLVAAHQAKAVGWNKGFSKGEAVLSAGPFRIASQTESSLTLVRNERFWGTPANLDSIVFRLLDQSTAAMGALENREVDLITPRLQVDVKDQLAKVPEARAETVPASSMSTWTSS